MSLILYLLQVTCCLAFFYGFYYLTLRKETMFETNRFYLVITLAASIVLPLVKIYIDAQAADPGVLLSPYVYVGSYVDAITTDIVVAPNFPFSWDRLIMGIYFLGIALMVIRLLKAVQEIQSIRRKGRRKMVDGRWIILSDKVKSPFSFFNTIYFPGDHRFEETEIKEIVAHELAHVRGRHTLDVLFMEMACIVLWPSPLIYLYRKALRDVHEYVADAAVLKQTHWENYAHLLLSQQQGQLQNILSNQLIYSQLKKRLLMMNQKRSGTLAGLKYLGFIPVMLVAMILFSFREKGTTDVIMDGKEQDTSTARMYHLYRDGLPIKTELGKTFGIVESERKNPIFPGCANVATEDQEHCSMNHLAQYIQDNMVYPESVKDAGVQGRVVVKFTVGADGLVKDIKVVESLHPDADQVVVKMVSDMNVKVGKWLPATKEGKNHDAEMHLPVKFVSGPTEVKEEPLMYAEELPRFPGCEDIHNAEERSACATRKLYEFIYTNINYPREDRENGIQGHCLVQFTIGVDGSITDFNVVRTPSESIKEEVIRIMNVMAAMPEKWIPARNEGKPVAMRFTLPVKFKLQDDEAIKESPAPEPSALEQDDKAVSVVASEQQAGTVKVIPNPASETITIELIEDTQSISIFNAGGNLVLSRKVSGQPTDTQSMDVSTLPAGRYVVQLMTTTGSATGQFSILK